MYNMRILTYNAAMSEISSVTPVSQLLVLDCPPRQTTTERMPATRVSSESHAQTILQLDDATSWNQLGSWRTRQIVMALGVEALNLVNRAAEMISKTPGQPNVCVASPRQIELRTPHAAFKTTHIEAVDGLARVIQYKARRNDCRLWKLAPLDIVHTRTSQEIPSLQQIFAEILSQNAERIAEGSNANTLDPTRDLTVITNHPGGTLMRDQRGFQSQWKRAGERRNGSTCTIEVVSPYDMPPSAQLGYVPRRWRGPRP
jgi:hypothetical protein